MNEQALGAKIKARREELGLSQNDLAKELDLDQGKVSLIERGGRKIDMVNELPVLAKVLKKPIKWFFELEPEISDSDPVKSWLAEVFPGIYFEDFEIRRIKKFLEPVIDSFIQSDPNLQRKISNQ